MSLTAIFEELYATAAARATDDAPGESLRMLRQGAEVRVRVQGRRRQVILGRARVPVGEVEVATFRRDGQIPGHAERQDWPRTRRGWCYISLTWETDQIGLFDD